MKLDLRGASRGREFEFAGGRHDGEDGNTLDYLSVTEEGDVIDFLDGMTTGYVETGVGPRLRFVWRDDLRHAH